MINLRSVYATNGNLSGSGQQSISINFANSVLGNIGAPLNDSWVIGADYINENEEYVIVSGILSFLYQVLTLHYACLK